MEISLIMVHLTLMMEQLFLVGILQFSGTVPNFASIQVDGIFKMLLLRLTYLGSLTNNGTFNDGDGIINMTGG